jgi:NADPH:quinone reductase-like Zn-dependent oxidoreductase
VNIDSSTSVFIPGGSGGVGHFSVQIARIRGAKQVITSASKEDGIQILKDQYQIKDVINHAKENVVDRVLELTGGQGVDVVYDSTYLQSSFEKSTKTVKESGSWIVLGHFGQEDSAEAKSVAQRKAKLVHADLGRYWLGPERAQLKTFFQNSLSQGAKWIEEGKLKPYINQIIKLEEVQNALDQLKQGKGGFGKIVVKLL